MTSAALGVVEFTPPEIVSVPASDWMRVVVDDSVIAPVQVLFPATFWSAPFPP